MAFRTFAGRAFAFLVGILVVIALVAFDAAGIVGRIIGIAVIGDLEIDLAPALALHSFRKMAVAALFDELVLRVLVGVMALLAILGVGRLDVRPVVELGRAAAEIPILR